MKTQKNGIFEVILDNALQNAHYVDHDFYGSVFVKVQDHRPTGVVVGVHGTAASIPGNDWADVRSWWKSVFDDNAKVNLPTYFVSMATRLCQQALIFARDELNLPSTQVFVAGHSLGGAIAGLIPTKVKLPVRAVTFNAPGIKEAPGVTNYWARVINIRSQYDFVSAIGEAIGPVWDVPVPEGANAAKQAFKIAEEKSRRPIEFKLKDTLHIKSFLEDRDFLVSVLAQHKMINLWRALTHNIADPQTYASFEGLLQLLKHRYELA